MQTINSAKAASSLQLKLHVHTQLNSLEHGLHLIVYTVMFFHV